jgi:hypothetical protein
MSRHHGATSALRRWQSQHDRFVDKLDRWDGFDPQIPNWRFTPLRDAYNLADSRDNEVEPPERDHELLATVQASLRNVLSQTERRVLEMRYQSQNIDGALVRRPFTYRGRVIRVGQYLAADEVEHILPLARRALQAAGYLKIYGAAGGATYAEIATALGLRDRAHAFEIAQGALKKLNKALSRT